MDSDTLVAAIGSQIGMLETYVNWAIVVSLAIAWAGIRNAPEIELLGLKFDRRTAFNAAASAYLVGNCLVLILILRLGDLLLLIPEEAVVEGFSVLVTHAWVLNPFSYFGNSLLSHLHATGGRGLLIVTWWLCNTALFTLARGHGKDRARPMIELFLLLGLTSMVAIDRVIRIVGERLRTVAPALEETFAQSVMPRRIGAFVGIMIGLLIFVGVERMQQRAIAKRA